MRSTIDSSGRVVIPKPLRDWMGLTPGAELELCEREGRIEIEPAPPLMRLAKDRHGLSTMPAVELPPLTDEILRAPRQRRRDRPAAPRPGELDAGPPPEGVRDPVTRRAGC